MEKVTPRREYEAVGYGRSALRRWGFQREGGGGWVFRGREGEVGVQLQR